MGNLLKYCGRLLKTTVAIILLRVVGVFTFVVPRMGQRVKQLLFILTIVNELQRLSLFSNLTVEHVNQRLLRIRNKRLLVNVCDITQWGLIHLDVDTLRQKGINVEKLAQSIYSDSDIRTLASLIIDATPPSLRYNSVSMAIDIQRILKKDFAPA